jgi:fluoroquinolone resistance protein
MDTALHEDKTFDNIDYSGKKLSRTEYVDCTFINCNFTKTDISQHDFVDCVFKGCNLSLTIMENTGLKNISFKDCKLTGIDFSRCSNFLFAVSFENSPLDYSSFFKKKMKKALFTDCSIKEADFTETDLSMAIFKNCDLMNAAFVGSVLEKTDFRTARNYALDPELNKIKKAKFTYPGVTGLLLKYDIEIE